MGGGQAGEPLLNRLYEWAWHGMEAGSFDAHLDRKLGRFRGFAEVGNAHGKHRQARMPVMADRI